MNKITKNKWLIISLSLLIGISLLNCGKKKSGVLLLPDLVEGQGGPGISPDNPKIAQEETTTQEEAPSLQVVDDTGAVDTGTINNDTTSNNQDSSPAVIEIPNNQIPHDNSSNNNNQTATDNSSGSDNQTVADNTNTDIQEAIKDEDVAEDPQETTVASDTETSQVSEESNSGTEVASDTESSEQEAISEEDAQEEVATEEEEDAEEIAEIEEADNDEVIVSDESKKEEDKEKGNCKIQVKEIDTSKGRWYNTKEELLPHPKSKGKFIKAKGIHTYWAYEKLLVRVVNNCEGGKYKLTIIAKNLGKLPEWYHYFNVKVVNEKTGENLGTMLIRASDNRYHKGHLIITLPKGDNVLNILWTNDAYEKDVYDANIQIKRIKIQKVQIKEQKQILSRKGSRFCDTQGRWFVGTNPPSAYTYWANQTISYCFRTKKAGKYEVIVRAGNAKNGYPLMPEYKEFKILVAANGNSNYITIPAEQGKYQKGSTTLDLPEGDIVLNITWLNDLYQPDKKFDANIEIVRVRLKRVGDIESPISAFLLQNPNVTYKVVIPSIILILGALGMIYWLRKEKVA